MTQTIRILHLEDNPLDAALIQRAITEGGLAVETTVVDDESSFEAALAGEPFDLIITDYNLPSYDAISALPLVKIKRPETPVIVISGTVGEETAVKCLQMGATDYLLKQHLDRLVPAVRRAIDDSVERRQRREIEQRLIESEVRYRRLFESAKEGILLIDAGTGMIVDANPSLIGLLGLSREGFLGKKVWDLGFLKDIVANEADFAEWRQRETIYHKGVSLETADGRQLTVEFVGNIYQVHQQEMIQCNIRDVTERHRAEEALREKEEHLQAVLQNARDAIISADSNGRIISWNSGAQVIFGWIAEEILNEPLTRLMPDRYHEAHEAGRRCYLSSGEARVVGKTVELHGRRKDGSEFPVEISLAAWRGANGRFFTAILRDISKRKAAAMALAESEERFRQLAEQSSEGFWFVALNPERVVYVSPAVQKVWGLPTERFYQDPGTWLTAIHPDDQPRIRAAWEACLNDQSSRFEEEYRVVRPDGSIRSVVANGTAIRNEAGEVIRLCGVVRDITEQKNLEAQALRTQRLESLGTLSSGIAHDLNNALAPILMATEILKGNRLDSEMLALVDMVSASATRSAGMVQQILTFARGARGGRVPVQLSYLLKEFTAILNQIVSKTIEIRTTLPKGLWVVTADTTQLHQVFMNLCVNARDAMPAGGRLSIAAENITLDEQYARMHAGAKSGPYVRISVTDTGTGMPPEVRDRIFEPFFTTKPPDKGTGLGLSSVRSIVTSHGGFLSVYSEVGKGTRFNIYLPAQPSASESAAVVTETVGLPMGDGELVLVVDDEAAIRDITAQTLRLSRYEAVTAANGAVAMVVFAEHRDRIKLTITDLAMPVMDGPTLVRAVRSVAPELKIILTSGLREWTRRSDLEDLGELAFLEKPYTAQQLLRAIHKVFHGE